MNFAVIGTNFKNTNIDLRDLVSFSDTKKLAMFNIMETFGIDYGVILSTCNRSELYFLYEKEEQIEDIKQAYLNFFNLSKEKIKLFEYRNHDALQYLFEVACGLQSLVIGEDQILGQIVESMEFSKSLNKMNKISYRIFQDAIACAKKIHTDIKISEHPLSISYIGIQQILSYQAIENKKVMVIGAGKMSSLAMRYIFDEKPAKVYNANRSKKNAFELKKIFPDLELIDFDQRYETLKTCDIVISATSCPHILLKKDRVLPRSNRLICLDLASPRDIDPELKKEKLITLFDIDSLETIANSNLKKREELVESSHIMIKERIDQLENWIRSSHVDETIASLKDKCDEIVEGAYTLLDRKLDLTKREKYILHKTLYASMYRLMKEPFRTLKQLDEEKQTLYQEIIKDLFQMEE